jgi:hypothetical protein
MSQWQSIDTAPKGKVVLLWGPTDISDNGTITNWKMETGYWIRDGWIWDGRSLRPYDVKPTHWMPLPEPPETP